MFRILRKTAALVAFVGFASCVQASNPVIGALDPYAFGTLNSSMGVSVGDPVLGFSGAFDNTFSFVQGSYPAVTGMWAGLDAYGDMLAQYRLGFGAVPTWSGWSASVPVPINGNGAFSFTQTMGGLTPGQTYWFELRGSASQASYTVTLAPVPEPESWALLMSGLGLLGFVAHRRSKVSAA